MKKTLLFSVILWSAAANARRPGAFNDELGYVYVFFIGMVVLVVGTNYLRKRISGKAGKPNHDADTSEHP